MTVVRFSSAFVFAILLLLAIRHTRFDANQDDSDSIAERRKLLEEKVSIRPASFKPQVHVGSSWIGNRWFPSLEHYRIYGPDELKEVFSKYNILWIGDTTARQDYTTLYAILNRTNTDITVLDIDDPRVIDINLHNKRVKHEEPCTKREDLVICRENQGKLFDWHLRHCAHRIDTSKWQTFWKDYNLVIISVGAMELSLHCSSLGHNKDKNDTQHVNFAAEMAASTKRLLKLVDGLTQVKRDDLMVVFRTMGSIGNTEGNANLNKDSWQEAIKINQAMVEKMDAFEESYIRNNRQLPTLSYVDFGRIILPHRSFPEKARIKGNLPAHYGWEARIAFLQMLANHVEERERQKVIINQDLSSQTTYHGTKGEK